MFNHYESIKTESINSAQPSVYKPPPNSGCYNTSPDADIVHRVNTSLGSHAVSDAELKTLMDLFLGAAPRD